MIPIEFKFVKEELAGLNKRNRAKVTKPLLQEMLTFWLNRFLRRHFDKSAFYRYRNFKDRGTKTISEPGKRFVARSDRPNFETGQMMRRLRLSARIRGTAKKATLTMRGPWYTTIKGPNQPDKPAEITAFTRTEAKEIAQFAARRVVALIRKLNKGTPRGR